MTVTFHPVGSKSSANRTCLTLRAPAMRAGAEAIQWRGKRTGLSKPAWRVQRSGFLACAFAVLFLTSSVSLAGTWKKFDVPAYAKSVEILAIGNDGTFYSVSSNRHGIFFQSLPETYRFEQIDGADRGGRLTRRLNVVFLAESCDGYTAQASGRWSLGDGGKSYRLTVAGGEVTSFHLLSGEPEPRHSC